MMAKFPQYITLLIFIIFIMNICFFVGNYGFWRHDAWSYIESGFPEFQDNGRWLAAISYIFLKHLQNYIACILSITLLWLYGYLFIRRFYLNTIYHNDLICFILPLIMVVSPGFLDQLTWPTHSLAAILIIFLSALLVTEKGSLVILAIATFLVFSILQTFSFLTLLLAIPAYFHVKFFSPYKIFLKFIFIIFIWISSLFTAWLLNRFIQYLYFGQIPALPIWRQANPAVDITSLYRNLTKNLLIYVEHIDTIYLNEYVVVLISIIIILLIMLFISDKISELVLSSFLVICGIILSLSIYLFTAPIGVMISFRGSLVVGTGAMLIFLAIHVAAINLKLKSFYNNYLIIIIIIFLFNPSVVSYINTKWFFQVTNSIVNSIRDIEESKSSTVKLVIIDARTKNLYPTVYIDIFKYTPHVFEDINEDYKLTPAFKELGYNRIIWCLNSQSHPLCKQITDIEYNRCSKTNLNICSGGINSEEKIWFIQFSEKESSH